MDIDRTRRELTLFADYHSFEIRDAHADYDLAAIDDTTADLRRDLISSRDGVVTIGTARRRDVRVVIEIGAEAPGCELASWDHVTEASVEIASGQILVLGGSDSRHSAHHFPVPVGVYRVRTRCAGFGTISADGTDGAEVYRVQIWPGTARRTTVLKRFTGELPRR
ncbi:MULTISPECIES: hypothetical protein [Saccharopolyspora]|uniref:Uncharacterized protein n=1 Tax=Saccharopolyspora gregorii TaxID=33914 RepID=A0ABP6RTV8_9PSEU|nr:hypothetical protein [Saccharopolyspora sp. 6V]MCA1193040.1 hypothetical protein [Saccharopolyspora sp. 6V]